MTFFRLFPTIAIVGANDDHGRSFAQVYCRLVVMYNKLPRCTLLLMIHSHQEPGLNHQFHDSHLSTRLFIVLTQLQPFILPACGSKPQLPIPLSCSCVPQLLSQLACGPRGTSCSFVTQLLIPPACDCVPNSQCTFGTDWFDTFGLFVLQFQCKA